MIMLGVVLQATLDSFSAEGKNQMNVLFQGLECQLGQPKVGPRWSLRQLSLNHCPSSATMQVGGLITPMAQYGSYRCFR